MAKTRMYRGTISNIHVDDRRGHATVDVTTDDGTTYTLWTNSRQNARRLADYFLEGDYGEIGADPDTLRMDGSFGR